MSASPRVFCIIIFPLFLAQGPFVFAQHPSPSSNAQASAPRPVDLLEVEEPRTPHLSPNGRSVLVHTRRADIEKNQYQYSVWHIPTDTPGAQVRLDLPKRAHAFEWMPEGRRIAFLAPTERGNQVWTKRIGADSARQITEKKGGVESFAFSPDGERLAYTTEERTSASSGEASDSLRGVVVDMRSFRARQLRNDRLSKHSREFVPPTTQLWVREGGGTETKVIDSLTVEEFRWSPSGDRLALTGVPAARQRTQAEGLILYRTALYVYERASGHLRRLHKGHQDTNRVWEGTISYSRPFWSPEGNRLGFLRNDESDRFASVAEVGVHDLDRGTTRFVTSAENQELDGPTFHWVTPDTVLVEYTHQAQDGLFRLSLDDGRTVPVWTPDDGEADGFSFSADHRRAAWVEQSLGRPPEVYTARRSFASPRRLSSLNDSMRDLWLPEVESIEWMSSDGTTVQGWLVRPGNRAHSEPPPLLVYVHGGPGAEMNNQFALNRGWGRPIQVFAARGYAVFMPNYRQSDSFGKAFQEVSALDEEPVDDIVTGIEHLVATGEADRDRIGIMGNSWGGWLGALVAAETPIFQAASLGEGVKGNALSSYGHGYGWAARGLDEYYAGSTPYENPERYLERSPAFRNQFTKTTPTLLEHGQNSGTVLEGIEVGRALWRHGTPHEVVIYPDAGHGLREPALLLESMRRNLRWFERWMSSDPASSSVTR